MHECTLSALLPAARLPVLLPTQFTGYLNVPGPGSWSFQLSSDDGSRLVLDGAVVIVNGGYHGNQAVSYTNSNLTDGLHSIQYACLRQHGQPAPALWCACTGL